MTDFLQQLEEIVGKGGLLGSEQVSIRNKSYWDASPMKARALVRPKTTEQVCAVLKLCHQHKINVVTHGGLTGTVQGTLSGKADLVLSMERLNAIEEIDPQGRTATVQAGVVLQTLQENVKQHDLMFPLDLGARGSCTIGGNIATNAGGVNVIRYGMMRELVLGLEVVLADGTLISSMNRMLKNNAGYDLKQLFVGTEGTLGIVTRAIVKLKELPLSANSALVAVNEFSQVVDLLKFVDKSLGGQLTSYELMWRNYYQAVTEAGWHESPLPRNYPYYVVLEAQGADPQADKEHFQLMMEAAMEKGLIEDAVLPKSEAERDKVWAIREDFEALLSLRPQFIYDVSLPIKDMDHYIQTLEQRLSERWSQCPFYALGHIGDGNLHFFVSPQNDDSADLHHQVNQIIYEPLEQCGGSVSAEHGIGLEKKAYLSLSRNAEEIALMKSVKNLFDPFNLLNPGKIF